MNRRVNGHQEVEECFHCGNEYLRTWKTFGNSWVTRGCEICTRLWHIKRYKRQFHLDLRNMVRKPYPKKGWMVEDAGDLERINIRVRRTMGYAIGEVGYDLASRILMKCIKDYWNEVKGRWVHDYRSSQSSQKRRSQQPR